MEYMEQNEVTRSRRAELIRQIVLFVLVLILMIFAVSSVSRFYRKQNLMIIKQSAQRAAVECYSVEGIYPPNIEYLVDNYSFTYNSEKYFIFYDSFASNVMPNVEVYERK